MSTPRLGRQNSFTRCTISPTGSRRDSCQLLSQGKAGFRPLVVFFAMSTAFASNAIFARGLKSNNSAFFRKCGCRPLVAGSLRINARSTSSPARFSMKSDAPPLPETPENLRGMNETAPLYAVLAGAQLLPFLSNLKWEIVDVAYFGLTALCMLVIGCKRSPLQSVDLSAPLSKTQVLLAPLIASTSLFGAYLALRYTSLDINVLFNVLTTVVGGICLKESLDPFAFSALKALRIPNPDLSSPKNGADQDPEAGALSLSDIVSAVIATFIVACYSLHIFPELNFMFSNAIAIGIGARILALVRPDSFIVASVLLVGLCFYDIFWVYGTDVMVTVATKIDSPGKLLFPRDMSSLTSTKAYPFSVLGLGDVCVPGIFATLTLALDAMIVQKRSPSDLPAVIPAGPYFYAAIIAYVLGLGSCFGVNFATNAAQPALLYLVPALISSTLIVAALRGELQDVLQFRLPPRSGVSIAQQDQQND